MNNKSCFICNKDTRHIRASVQCPKCKKLVCMTHCYKECEHLDRGYSVERCSYALSLKRKKEK